MSSANTNTMEIESSEYVLHTIDIHWQGHLREKGTRPTSKQPHKEMACLTNS
jgi:hypothetical protein